MFLALFAGAVLSGLARRLDSNTFHEVLLNGSIIVLIGSFAIGVITGEEGFTGVLCLFLLDMGLIAVRGLREGRKHLTPTLVLFGLYMPRIGVLLGGASALVIGLSSGGSTLMITLRASASYIAVPAALQLALPQARPAIYLPLSLGVTFPFSLMVGIPLYVMLATALQ